MHILGIDFLTENHIIVVPEKFLVTYSRDGFYRSVGPRIKEIFRLELNSVIDSLSHIAKVQHVDRIGALL